MGAVHWKRFKVVFLCSYPKCPKMSYREAILTILDGQGHSSKNGLRGSKLRKM